MFVFFGGAVGAVVRYGLGHLMQGRVSWLTGTLVVNWLGCLMMGAIAAWAAVRPDLPWLRPLVLAGFLGGMTTFSAFALETHQFWDLDPFRAIWYLVLSLAGGLALYRLGAGMVS